MRRVLILNDKNGKKKSEREHPEISSFNKKKKTKKDNIEKLKQKLENID